MSPAGLFGAQAETVGVKVASVRNGPAALADGTIATNIAITMAVPGAVSFAVPRVVTFAVLRAV